MGRIVEDLAAGFAKRDSRFHPAEHLHVWFEQLATIVGVWTGGVLRIVGKPLSQLPPI